MAEVSAHLDMYEPVFTIGVVARKLDISVQTVRLYQDEGLVLPHRTESGHRLYSLHDLDRLQCIRRMITEYGMNLQGIKRMFSLSPCWKIKDGPLDDCKTCPAYFEVAGPCWSLPVVGDKCKDADCRNCKVYRLKLDCSRMKKLLFGNEAPGTQGED